MPVSVELDIPEWLDIAEDYQQVGENIEDLEPPLRQVMELLESTHARHFRRLRGRYVRTGATRASLTGPGSGAIRDVEEQQAIFGTTVWYAHFLTKAPRDPNSGQIRKRPPGEGLSAVMVFSRTTQRKIKEMLMGHIVEPFGD